MRPVRSARSRSGAGRRSSSSSASPGIWAVCPWGDSACRRRSRKQAPKILRGRPIRLPYRKAVPARARRRLLRRRGRGRDPGGEGPQAIAGPDRPQEGRRRRGPRRASQLRGPHSDDEMDDGEHGWSRARAVGSGSARSHRL
ncbi:exported hypothetical protein [Streptomyces misionensis JCM 4497]